MSEWQALLAGFAFYLILEGIMPFFNPQGLKKLMAMSLQIPDQQLKRFGAIMLIIGVVLLLSIR